MQGLPSISSAAAYRGRAVLITGGFGFIGQNLVAALQPAGASVRVLGRSWPSTLMPEQAGGVDFVKGDIRDEVAVAGAVTGAEVIFNLAGKSGPAASNAAPLEDLDVNCRGHLTLLEACRKLAPAAHVVFSSSRLVYAPTTYLPVPETAPTGPLSIYGVHKRAAEDYHRLYTRLHGLPTTVLRITNPYGPFQHPAQHAYGIVNWFIHLALRGEEIPLYGEGRQLRDYVHVRDVVEALLVAGSSRDAVGATFNVGGGHGVSMAEMAEMIIRAAGSGRVGHRDWPPDAARVETGDFVADVTQIKQVLGWSPATPLEAGIREVVEAHRRL